MGRWILGHEDDGVAVGEWDLGGLVHDLGFVNCPIDGKLGH